MKNTLMKRVRTTAIVLVLITISLNKIVALADSSKQEAITITREMVAEMAVNNSITIKELENQSSEMTTSYEAMLESLKPLDELYNQFQTYKKLITKNSFTQSNPRYQDYCQLLVDYERLSIIDPIITSLSNILPANRTAEQTATLTALTYEKSNILPRVATNSGLEGSLSTDEKAQILTASEKIEYQTLLAQFSYMGIDMDMSDKEIFDTFIYPLKIVPSSLKTGIQQLSISTRVAKASISMGALQIYNSLLMLYDLSSLQEASIQLSTQEYQGKSYKFEQGLISELELIKAENTLRVSELEADKLNRQIENLELTMKNMIGLNLDAIIVLDDSINTNFELKSIEDYLKDAKENRSEVQLEKAALNNAKNELEWTKSTYWFGTDQVKIAEISVSSHENSLNLATLTLEKEIMGAYADVELKKHEMDLKSADYISTMSQAANMKVYADHGYVSVNVYNSYKVLELQKQNESMTAQRNYEMALYDLESASGIGPAYSANGGTNNEN